MKKNDFNKLAEQAKNKIKNAKDKAQDKMQDLELDKKLDSLKEQTQKTMSATAEKVKEMELDKKLSNLNDNVEKYAKATAEKTKETVSSAAKTVKDMELDKKIENSEFEKRTGIFAKIKRYRAVIVVGILILVVVSIFVNINKNPGNDISPDNNTSQSVSKNTTNSAKKSLSALQEQYPNYSFISGTPYKIERMASIDGQMVSMGEYGGNDDEEKVLNSQYDITYMLHVVTYMADGSMQQSKYVITDTPKMPLKSWYKSLSNVSAVNQKIIGMQPVDSNHKLYMAIEVFDSKDYEIGDRFKQPN